MLTRIGVSLDYKSLSTKIGEDGIRKLRKIFTIVTIGHGGNRKTITAARVANGNLLLPRFSGAMLEKVGMAKITNFLQLGEDRTFVNTATMTSNQKIILTHALSTVYTDANVTTGTASTIVQMDPGYGKTYLAVGLITALKKKTFIIAPTIYLLKQWVSILEAAFPASTIGCYYGTNKKDGDIVVAVINSALKYGDFSSYGLIIYDEVHLYCTGLTAKIFYLAQAACCMGLTATPNTRLDKFDPIARWSLGSVIYSDKVLGWDPSDIKFTSRVVRVLYSGPDEYTQILTSAAGIVSVPLMVNQLQLDNARNNMIVDNAIKLYIAGHNTFVFSDRREHLHTLALMLAERKIKFEAPEIVKLLGGATSKDIEQAQGHGRIIMTTYQYSSVGISINKMNAMILATPRKSNMTQILGRIFRMSDDNSAERIIIDIVDKKICLKSQYYSRKKEYDLMGATITTEICAPPEQIHPETHN
jgi:superfamily II DNA or RNA helicase